MSRASDSHRPRASSIRDNLVSVETLGMESARSPRWRACSARTRGWRGRLRPHAGPARRTDRDPQSFRNGVNVGRREGGRHDAINSIRRFLTGGSSRRFLTEGSSRGFLTRGSSRGSSRGFLTEVPPRRFSTKVRRGMSHASLRLSWFTAFESLTPGSFVSNSETRSCRCSAQDRSCESFKFRQQLSDSVRSRACQNFCVWGIT